MSVELREGKWCGVLGIEKVGVESYWMVKTIANGLIVITGGNTVYDFLMVGKMYLTLILWKYILFFGYV